MQNIGEKLCAELADAAGSYELGSGPAGCTCILAHRPLNLLDLRIYGKFKWWLN